MPDFSQIALTALLGLALALLAQPSAARACRTGPAVPVGLLPREGEIARPGMTLGVVSVGGNFEEPFEPHLYLESDDAAAEVKVALEQTRRLRVDAFVFLTLYQPEAPLQEGRYRVEVSHAYADDEASTEERAALAEVIGPIHDESHFEVVAGPLPGRPQSVLDTGWVPVTYDGGVESSCGDYSQGHAVRLTLPEADTRGTLWAELKPDSNDDLPFAVLPPDIYLDDWEGEAAAIANLGDAESLQAFETTADVVGFTVVTHDLYGRQSEPVHLEPEGCVFVGRKHDGSHGDRSFWTHRTLDWSDVPECNAAPSSQPAPTGCSAAPRSDWPLAPLLLWAAALAWPARRRTAGR